MQMIALFDELIEQQQQVLLDLARSVIPHLTLDDLMQPNDFPQLEYHPFFRYEEGVLHGLQAAKASFLGLQGLSLEKRPSL
jgi:hypothetical protein